MTYAPGGTELLNPETLLAELGLAPGMRVADLGCGGTGHFVLAASHIVGSTGLVYAIDILKSALTSVASRARGAGMSNVKTVWSNLEIVGAAKIPTGSLDAALLINNLFQSTKHREILQEAQRLLKPTGLLLIVDWQVEGGHFGPPAEQRVAPDTIKKIALEIGFQSVKDFQAGTHHYGLILKR